MPDQMPWRDAIVEVLRLHKEPMHYATIADRIEELGLRTSLGATPAATVASQISQSLKSKSPKSPFERVQRGHFRLRDTGQTTDTALPDDEETDAKTGLVAAFGMYWERDHVDWKTTSPPLLGQQSESSDRIDFTNQVGVYLLYDRHDTVYVGQSNEGHETSSIGKRLRAHTRNRLKSRWDRFSWFGLSPVGEEVSGPPTQANDPDNDRLVDAAEVIGLLEAVLIEAMEPRQNRRQGDFLFGKEYLQVKNPMFEKQPSPSSSTRGCLNPRKLAYVQRINSSPITEFTCTEAAIPRRPNQIS